MQMAVGMVYPSLKPMFEASIRKVTVRVRWKEGRREQELVAVQYVTNPLEGGLNPNAADAMNALLGDGSILSGSQGTGTGTPGPTGTPGGPGANPGGTPGGRR